MAIATFARPAVVGLLCAILGSTVAPPPQPATVGKPVESGGPGKNFISIPTELQAKELRWAIVPAKQQRHIRILIDEHVVFDNTVDPMSSRRPAVWLFGSGAIKDGTYKVTVIDPENDLRAETTLKWPEAREVQIWIGSNRVRVEVDGVSGWR